MVTKRSVLETQNLAVNPKSQPKPNFEKYQFLVKYISRQNLSKEKNLFWGHFCPNRIFHKHRLNKTVVGPYHLNLKITE